MQKELNPELFGETNTKSRVLETKAPNQLIGMEQKVSETRGQIYQLSENLSKIVSQINEFMKSSQLKFERLNASVQRLEQGHQALNTEAVQKLGQLHNRFAERKTMDLKIQEMMDRHNSVLRSFEMRLGQMHKVLTEKEAQLLQSQSALNDAKMEIARLKRF